MIVLNKKKEALPLGANKWARILPFHTAPLDGFQSLIPLIRSQQQTLPAQTTEAELRPQTSKLSLLVQNR